MGRQLAEICESLADDALRSRRILFVGWETKVLRRLLDGFVTELAIHRKIPTLLFSFARPAAAVRSHVAVGSSGDGDALFIDDSRRHSCDELARRCQMATHLGMRLVGLEGVRRVGALAKRMNAVQDATGLVSFATLRVPRPPNRPLQLSDLYGIGAFVETADVLVLAESSCSDPDRVRIWPAVVRGRHGELVEVRA
jgi:hypothetical protein